MEVPVPSQESDHVYMCQGYRQESDHVHVYMCQGYLQENY
jgi:hypothetical protein